MAWFGLGGSSGMRRATGLENGLKEVGSGVYLQEAFYCMVSTGAVSEANVGSVVVSRLARSACRFEAVAWRENSHWA